MLFIDDYSRMTWVAFLKEKSEALDKFKAFKEQVEKEMDTKINALERIEEENLHHMNLICIVKRME